MSNAGHAEDEKFNAGAAFAAGLVAGSIFLGLEVFTAYAFGANTPYGPAHVTLRALIEAEVPSGHLTWGLIAGVLFIHFFLSVLMTTILAMFTHRQERGTAMVVGALFGAVLYFGNFYLVVMSVPALLAAQGLFMFVNYVIFGVVAAWTYKRLARHFSKLTPASR